MLETPAEVTALQGLLDRSYSRSGQHLRTIVTREHALRAADLVALLTGMKVLSVATVTADGEPRISALDGHFLHGTWTFSTAGTAAKARHLAARPSTSVAHIDGERLAVFAHGSARRLDLTAPDGRAVLDHWTAHYGSSPLTWADEICMYRLEPSWMIGYAADRSALRDGRPG